VFGVVSFGDGCAREFPGIYGKVASPSTLRWIKEYIIRTNSDICSDPAARYGASFFDE
jgi:hypothetical protein